jgi:hypothetical protein
LAGSSSDRATSCSPIDKATIQYLFFAIAWSLAPHAWTTTVKVNAMDPDHLSRGRTQIRALRCWLAKVEARPAFKRTLEVSLADGLPLPVVGIEVHIAALVASP